MIRENLGFRKLVRKKYTYHLTLLQPISFTFSAVSGCGGVRRAPEAQANATTVSFQFAQVDTRGISTGAASLATGRSGGHNGGPTAT